MAGRLVLLALLMWPTLAMAQATLPVGDAVLKAKAGPSEIVLTTTKRLAGAVHSITWSGQEFIDSTDHGRQLQSACSFNTAKPGEFWAEAFNPTEAGSRRDGAGPSSSSKLLFLKASETELLTVVQPAFWLNPGEKSSGRPALNKASLSDHLISKHLTLNYLGLAHAMSYRVTFTVPPGELHTYAQFEAVTGYMPPIFSQFWTLNMKSGMLAELSDGPGEQSEPVILSTPNGSHAMGVWSADQPSRGFEKAGYGRFRFVPEKVVKWNCVFRLQEPKGVPSGNYSYQMIVAIGTLKNVQDTLLQASQRLKPNR